MTSISKAQPKSRQRLPSAIRSGVYSMLAVLPGEDQSAYDKSRREIFAVLKPVGVLQEDVVQTVARLTWRKNNCATLQIAMMARHRLSVEISKVSRDRNLDFGSILNAPTAETLTAARETVREEFKGLYDLDTLGLDVSLEALERELDLQERFQSMIERSLKLLFNLKGLSSISGGESTPSVPRISGPPQPK